MAISISEDWSSFDAHDGGAAMFGAGGLVMGEITFDASYPTGGEAVAISDFGTNTAALATTLTRFVFSAAGDDYIHRVHWDGTLLVVYVGATGAEVADTTDLSALIVPFIAYFA